MVWQEGEILEGGESTKSRVARRSSIVCVRQGEREREREREGESVSVSVRECECE